MRTAWCGGWGKASKDVYLTYNVLGTGSIEYEGKTSLGTRDTESSTIFDIRYSIFESSNRRISNRGSNRQIFDRSNHRIIEYRIGIE